MSRREVAALLYAARNLLRDPRLYYMLLLQYLLALRVGEVVLLRYEDVGTDRDERGLPSFIRCPTLKQGTGRPGYTPQYPPRLKVPVLSHPEVVAAAFDRERRTERRERVSPWLFPGQDRADPLDRKTAIELFHDAKRAAYLRDWYTPHALRHTAGTQLYAASGKKLVVSAFLRHSVGSGRARDEGAAVTERYIHVTDEMWREYRGALDLPRLEPILPDATGSPRG